MKSLKKNRATKGNFRKLSHKQLHSVKGGNKTNFFEEDEEYMTKRDEIKNR